MDTSPFGALDRATSVFLRARPRLVRIAYRILGSASEAEDVVQEAWLRWQGTDRTVVTSPAAFLATTTTRLALNVAQSARRRRETADPSLAEPVDPSPGPEAEAERGEAVELAVLLVLERLTPAERAVYVLRVGFDYPYRQISELLHLGVANTRQLVRRAHQRIATERHEPASAAAHRRLVRAFLSARDGDLADLEDLLAADVASGDVDRRGVRMAATSSHPRRPSGLSR